MRIARIGVLGILVLGPVLIGCADDDPAPPPQESPLGPTPAACQQEAQKLGFMVVGVEGTPEQQLDGSTDYPILVQWGNDGGVHLRCRVGTGGVTIG